MENSINILDLIVQELNRTQSLKSSIEAKAVGFMTPVTVILGILATFLTNLSGASCQSIKNIFICVCVAVFIIGIFLLVLFVKVLFPSEMKYFDAENLIKVYTSKLSEIEKTAKIINDATNAVDANKKKMATLSKCNKIISIGLFVIIFGFVAASALFFIMVR